MSIPSLEEIRRRREELLAHSRGLSDRSPAEHPLETLSPETREETARFGLETLLQYSEDEWNRLAAQKSFRAFIARMYPGYMQGQHIALLQTALEKAMDTPNYRLMVTLPPRHSKSLHVSENAPAFYLGKNPDNRVMQVSHTADLAFTFSRRVRNKILDPRWPFLSVGVAGDKSAVKAWDIAGRLGGYLAVGVGGSPAGHGANLIIIDDPIGSVAEAESEASREALKEWYHGTIRDRLEPGGSMIVTATRWHEDDLSGHLLAEMRNGGEIWNHLHLPAINSKGEALWPERWPIEALQQIKKAVGSRVWAARFQGMPSPLEGGLLQRGWWRFYRSVPQKLKGHIQSWDMAFKETKEGSYVVGQVWATLGADRYLLDQVRFRGDFPATLQMFRAFSKKWPQAKLKLIESKANGPAVAASLRSEISGIVEINPIGGKLARASAVSAQIESGNVYLPDPSLNPWVYDFIEECAQFPHGSHDDQVDAMSQALARLETNVVPKALPTVLPPRSSVSRLARHGGLSRTAFQRFTR
jgi:predicted phage terminase large subunit-like protein